MGWKRQGLWIVFPAASPRRPAWSVSVAGMSCNNFRSADLNGCSRASSFACFRQFPVKRDKLGPWVASVLRRRFGKPGARASYPAQCDDATSQKCVTTMHQARVCLSHARSQRPSRFAARHVFSVGRAVLTGVVCLFDATLHLVRLLHSFTKSSLGTSLIEVGE